MNKSVLFPYQNNVNIAVLCKIPIFTEGPVFRRQGWHFTRSIRSLSRRCVDRTSSLILSNISQGLVQRRETFAPHTIKTVLTLINFQ
jgi:hypothetical protein